MSEPGDFDQAAAASLIPAIYDAFRDNRMPRSKMFPYRDDEAKELERAIGWKRWDELTFDRHRLPVVLAICLLELPWFVYYIPSFMLAACQGDSDVANDVLHGIDPTGSDEEYIAEWTRPRARALSADQSATVVKFIRIFGPGFCSWKPRYADQAVWKAKVERLAALWGG